VQVISRITNNLVVNNIVKWQPLTLTIILYAALSEIPAGLGSFSAVVILVIAS